MLFTEYIIGAVHCIHGGIPYNGMCYFISEDITTWPMATDKCQQIDGNLVNIPNKDVFYFLETNILPSLG